MHGIPQIKVGLLYTPPLPSMSQVRNPIVHRLKRTELGTKCVDEVSFVYSFCVLTTSTCHRWIIRTRCSEICGKCSLMHMQYVVGIFFWNKATQNPSPVSAVWCVYGGHTPAKQHEWPPLLGQSAEDHHQHEVKHDTLTQHPAEGRQEEVLKESGYHSTANLMVKKVTSQLLTKKSIELLNQ